MKKRSLFLTILLLCFLAVSSIYAQNQEVLVKFKGNVSEAERDSILKELNLNSKSELKQLNITVCELTSSQSIVSIQQNASQFAEIEYIESNVTYQALNQDQEKIQSKLYFDLDQLDEKTFNSDEIIVKFKLLASSAQIDQFKRSQNYEGIKYIERLGTHLCKVSPTQNMRNALVACAAADIVEYVEPNYIVRAIAKPNDPKFNDQWGLNNSNDADIDALEAWDIQAGDQDIKVGIIDTGIDYNHEDLKRNYWFNPGERGDGKEQNGFDDDNNGYIDDWRGWDFKSNDNNPMDENGHGTHCAGIVAAEGNNGKGISGAAWKASLVGLRFLDRDGSGTVADAAEAVIYAADNNVKILSNSWGGTEYSRTLEDAIRYAAGRSVLFLAASGNDNKDNDTNPHYPCNYAVENVISIAASTDGDRIADFSNYGEISVDLAAPGENILSTYFKDNRYERLSGTSMATSFVSGVAALISSEFTGISMNEIKYRLFGGVDYLSAWKDRVVTDGRLNAAKSLSHSPIISLTKEYGNTKDVAGPYNISSFVIDDSSLSSVKLIYYLNGSTRRDTLEMKVEEDQKYLAGIPGQPFGITVSYYVVAYDAQTNRSQSRIFTFKVSESGNDCCGGAAFTTTAQEGNRMLAGFAVFSNVLIILLPWSFVRYFYRRKNSI